MNSARLIVLAATALLMQGCSFLTPPLEQPVQQDYVGNIFGKRPISVFSMTPERRTVMIMADENNTRAPMKFCAEPPADVAANIASSVRAAMEASVKGIMAGPVSPEVQAAGEFSRSLSATMMSLFYRSQGIQLFRDGLFNLCQARINGTISDAEYVKKHSELLDKAFVLILAELPNVQAARLQAMTLDVSRVLTEADATAKKADALAKDAEKRVDEARKALDSAGKKN